MAVTKSWSGWFFFFVALLLGLLCARGATAGDYYTSLPFPGFVAIGGEGATAPRDVIGKEYSHTNWFEVFSGGLDPRLVNVDDHDKFAVGDPGQVVSWDGVPGPIGGNSGSTDAFDYPVEIIDGSSRQVDALANRRDFLFNEVVGNTATLLFSVTADIDGSMTARDHIFYEDPAGGGAVWAAIEAPPAGPGPGPGVNHHVVEDLDGLEVWGPEPPGHTSPGSDPVVEGFVGAVPTADADRFSLDMDVMNGFSVWSFDPTSGGVSPYIPHGVVVEAVEDLFLGPDFDYAMETRDAIDVDGTMVRDVGEVGLWDAGDELLFTIDPIDFPSLPTGAPAPAIDGGEIMVLTNLGPGAPPAISFLFHGGHFWDTAFDVKGTFGYFYEDVDALEAVGTQDGILIPVPDPTIPEPSAVVLVALASLSTGVVSLGRRR